MYPEVPRVYHAGVKGTFMDELHHNLYFRDIDYNTDAAFAWPAATTSALAAPPPYLGAVLSAYEAEVAAVLRSPRTVHVTSVDDLPRHRNATLAVWYATASKAASAPFTPIGNFFGIWHEPWRGARQGLHRFEWFGGNDVLLINAHESPLVSLKPAPVTPLVPAAFKGRPRGQANAGYYIGPPGPATAARLPPGAQAVAAAAPGASCAQACADKGRRCVPEYLPILNTCEALMDAFGTCQGCDESFGTEQPAVEVAGGRCLYSSKPELSTCEAAHPATRRLCACAH